MTAEDARSTGALGEILQVTGRTILCRRPGRMRIIIVNKYAHVTGGADAYCLDIAAGLRAGGHDVAMLSTADARNGEVPGAFVRASVSR